MGYFQGTILLGTNPLLNLVLSKPISTIFTIISSVEVCISTFSGGGGGGGLVGS